MTGDSLPPPGILELDHVYQALAHPRRRYLCYTLLEDDEWFLTELAGKIAAWERDASEDAVDECDRERVLVSLYHAHVPKLVDDDIVVFDDTSETIRSAENAEQVLAALEAMGESLDGRRESHARGDTDDERD